MAKKTRASETVLGQLHEAIAKDLLNKVKLGTATAAEIAVAVKFLKDNGIEATTEDEGSSIGKLAHVLPDFSADDPEDHGTVN